MRPLVLLLASVALAALIGGCRALPEQGSAAEQLYAQRCGQCHSPYYPRSLTAAMWQIQVEVMQSKMEQAGIAPLTPDEEKAILNYLSRHSEQ